MSMPRTFCALSGLGIGLVFYLAHRSDHTVSNRLLNYFFGPSTYLHLKQAASHWLPMPGALRGCLPSALWCFIVTSMCGGCNFRLARSRILTLACISPLINAGWEAIQWFGFTDGHADWFDVFAGVGGWMIAHVISIRSAKPVEISALWSWRFGIVLSGFACMGFADVWK